MDAEEPRRELSVNCRRRRGEANRTHECTGCECGCHHLAAPANFRDLIQAALKAGQKEED